MLSLELCKALKDAGLPQTYSIGDKYYNEDTSSFEVITETELKMFLIGVLSENDFIKDPSLSELIEACGADFEQLYKDAVGFGACGGSKIALGTTADETVANLYIKLNEKKN